jgi:hypothetical protein
MSVVELLTRETMREMRELAQEEKQQSLGPKQFNELSIMSGKGLVMIS